MLVLTKAFVQEGEGSEVAAKTDKFSYDHEPVPGADHQRHHQQLRAVKEIATTCTNSWSNSTRAPYIRMPPGGQTVDMFEMNQQGLR